MKKIISRLIALSVIASVVVVVGCTQLPPVQDLPISNPLRSKPKFKLGKVPEPAMQAQAYPMPKADRVWGSRLAFLSEGISLYPKILPTVDNKTVYQANHKGTLVALDKKTGRKQWTLKPAYLISSGPTVVNDHLLIATQDAKVVSINKKTGVVEWATNISSEALASPNGDGNIVVIHSVDGKVIALNASDGKLLWTYEGVMPSLMLRGSSSPQVVYNVVLAGLANGKLVALNAESGLLAWEKSIAIPKGRSELNRMVDIRADLVVDEGAVFVAAFQGNITKIQLATGETQWQKPISTYHTLWVDENALYVTDAQHHILALDKETGEILWEQDNLAERYITAPNGIRESIVVGDRGGYLHFLNKKTGQIQGSHFVGNKIVSDLVVEDNQLFVSTQNGNLAVFKVSSK